MEIGHHFPKGGSDECDDLSIYDTRCSWCQDTSTRTRLALWVGGAAGCYQGLQKFASRLICWACSLLTNSWSLFCSAMAAGEVWERRKSKWILGVLALLCGAGANAICGLMPEAFSTTSLFGSPTFRVERKENTRTKERFHQFWPLIS